MDFQDIGLILKLKRSLTNVEVFVIVMYSVAEKLDDQKSTSELILFSTPRVLE